jgi:hypothetical protein
VVDFLFGAVSVVAGVLLIVLRKHFAASTVKQQNWFGDATTGHARSSTTNVPR